MHLKFVIFIWFFQKQFVSQLLHEYIFGALLMRQISKKKWVIDFCFLNTHYQNVDSLRQNRQSLLDRNPPSLLGWNLPSLPELHPTEDNRFSNPAVIIQYHLWFKMSTDMVRDWGRNSPFDCAQRNECRQHRSSRLRSKTDSTMAASSTSI